MNSGRRIIRALWGILPASQCAPELPMTDGEWDAFVQGVRTHGLPGAALSRYAEILPEQAASRLRLHQHRARARGLMLTRTTREVTDILKPVCGPRIAPLKGSFLLPCLYGDHGTRTTNDVDILIEGHRLDAVHATLLQQGFAYVPKPEGRPVSQTLNYERSYQSPSGLLVDVHRAFSDNERAEVDWEGVWARSLVMEEGPLQGMARLSPEDFLLSLVVHVGQDNFQGPLRQWFDLASWISECEIDWNAVKTRARSWNVTRLLAAVVTRLQVMGLRNEGMEMAFAEELQEASRYLGWWMKRDRVTPLSHGTPFRFGQLFLAIPLLDSHEKRLQWGRRYLKVRTQDWLASKKGSGKEN